jgi:hypothetical protein
MKKSILTFLMLFTFASLMAPTIPACSKILLVEESTFQSKAISAPWTISFAPLIDAIRHYESHYNDSIINEKEQAYGPLQIRPCRLEDYNKNTNSNYTMQDMFNFEIAKKIFLHFARGKDFEHAAKNWNGSGPKTITYWENVKNLL